MQSTDMSMSTLLALKALAADPTKASALVRDETCLGGLVMVLSNTDVNIVHQALQTLSLLAEDVDHKPYMRASLGLIDQLEMLLAKKEENSSWEDIQDLAQKVYNTCIAEVSKETENNPLTEQHNEHAAHEPLRDMGNQCRQTQKETSHKAHHKPSIFVGGAIKKNKVITLQIRGMDTKDDVDCCRSLLVRVKGVISITFNSSKKRAIIRTRAEMKPESLAQSISLSQTMRAQQIIKDDNGKEVLLSFGSNLKDLNKENEQQKMPDYPEDSPERDYRGYPARSGYKPSADAAGGWEYVKKISSFLSSSFYW